MFMSNIDTEAIRGREQTTTEVEVEVLNPRDEYGYETGRTFSGKALVLTFPDGTKQLRSYGTIVMELRQPGNVIAAFPAADASNTTRRHVYSFLRANRISNVNTAAAVRKLIKATTEAHEHANA